MSYPPAQPTSTSTSNDSTSGGPASSSHGHTNGQAQSPLDWTNFMSFTPPVPGSRAGNGNSTGQSQPDQNCQAGSGSSVHGANDHDGYQKLTHGATTSRRSPNSAYHRGDARTQPSPYAPHSSPSRDQLQFPQNNQGGSSLSPRANNGKGKSPVNRPPMHQHLSSSSSQRSQQQQSDTGRLDDGLTLDPDAFSRDIRFQVPPFLSYQVGGAPTFPPGGEAWSGFGANLFANDSGGGGQQLTPGALFGNTFDLSSQSGSGQTFTGNENSGGDRSVLEGLSGFMSESGWEGWGDSKDANGGATGLTPSNLGTTFYVNPNPSPNTLQKAQQVSVSEHPSSHDAETGKSNVTSLNTNLSQNNQVVQSPRITRNGHFAQAASQMTAEADGRQPTVTPSPLSATSGTMPTSVIFLQQPALPSNFYVPSLSNPTPGGQTASMANIASSSSQPYAPPSNAQSLLQDPQVPPNLLGPSLTDGPGLYSTTGFDMVGVLSRVANRRDPKTVLGPVDLSCSFLVVDIRRFDSPIVYASPTFMALTGYDQSQILGRNCRFLQSPDSDVVKGSKRKFTDNVAVSHLKRMLNAGKECQASLINYRKGGIPFINLVTVVPIPWEGTDIVYHVGFQVDLVEQPNAILRNMRDGSYQVNYTVANPPQASLRTAREANIGLSSEILDVLGPRINSSSVGSGEEGGKMEWLKMVIENADDFVHVLSLKGLFQYVSPSVRRVLEYEPEELLNMNISDICHPSDIVPVMRELKDSTHASSDGNSTRQVHLVFRIRHKSSGYVWIECMGRLHVEPGKGRKAVILSGRARNVPTLPWEQVSRHGGLVEFEAWAKVSFDGLILHATSMIYDLLGVSVEDVVGTSLYAFVPGGQNGPPSASTVGAEPKSSVASLFKALRSAASATSQSSAISLRQKLLKKNGSAVDVVFIFYPHRSSTETPVNSESTSSSPSSDDFPASTASSSIGGIKPSSLLVQIKLVSSSPTRSIVHPPTANVFEELETTRGTSWQYELHQLRLLNRRLKEDISAIRNRGGKANKGKKRKLAGDDSMAPPPLPNLPEQYAAAPRHQLAPGFGLVAPGMPNLSYQS